MSRTIDYLQTVTSLQHVLQDLEVNLDRTRAETGKIYFQPILTLQFVQFVSDFDLEI